MEPRIQYARTVDGVSIAIVAGSSQPLARTWVREVFGLGRKTGAYSNVEMVLLPEMRGFASARHGCHGHHGRSEERQR